MTFENISLEIEGIYDAGQKDREEKLYETDVDTFVKNDLERLARASEIYELFKNESLNLNGQALYHLAMVFHHAPITEQVAESYGKAFELAEHAASAGVEDAPWLTATTEDRYLLASGKKQKWGTQFERGENGEWQLSPMYTDEESGVTDTLRKKHEIAPRGEQLKAFLKICEKNGDI